MFFNGLRIDSTVHPEGLECIGTDPNVIFFPVAGFEIWGEKKKKQPKMLGFSLRSFFFVALWMAPISFFFFPPIPEFS